MTTISLPADCSRDAALATWETIRSTGPGAVTFNASAVEKIGQAMLQVLLVAGAGQPVIQPSAAMVDAARLAGLDLLIGEGQAA